MSILPLPNRLIVLAVFWQCFARMKQYDIASSTTITVNHSCRVYYMYYADVDVCCFVAQFRASGRRGAPGRRVRAPASPATRHARASSIKRRRTTASRARAWASTRCRVTSATAPSARRRSSSSNAVTARAPVCTWRSQSHAPSLSRVKVRNTSLVDACVWACLCVGRSLL